jgi:hypothetical protein
MERLCEAAAENMVFLIIGVCVLAGMVLNCITTLVRTQLQERTRREIAAYTAEGSIRPDQAERLIRANTE